MSNNPIESKSQNPLLIADLFQCVLDCLITSLPGRPGREERRMLAVLARTCRAFSNPSLNILWRRLNSLLPLLRCLSDVAYEARAEIPPSSPEWLVINRYSPRIQELTLGNEPLSMIFMQRTSLVLPNLRVFSFECPPKRGLIPPDVPFHSSIECIRPLLTPKLVTLKVRLNDPSDPQATSFLENYNVLCPNLKSIQFSWDLGIEDHPTVTRALSKALCSHANWKHVALSPPADVALLKHLGMCSTLTVVSLYLAPKTAISDKARFEPEDAPFTGVSDLSLTLQNSLDFVTCLLRPRGQAFRSFNVTLYAVIYAVEVSALLTVLASPQRMHSLQSITIRQTDPFTFWRDMMDSYLNYQSQPFSYEALSPLLPFVHLRELVVDLYHPVSLNDEEFACLVRNWPFLENLHMTWTRGEDPATSITLKGLLSLLLHCPKVRHIALTLNAKDVPVADADVCNPSIVNPVKFHNCTLVHPEPVARFLLKHLPSIPGVLPTYTCRPMWSALQVTAELLATRSYSKSQKRYLQLWMEVNKHIDPTFLVPGYHYPEPPEEVDYY